MASNKRNDEEHMAYCYIILLYECTSWPVTIGCIHSYYYLSTRSNRLMSLPNSFEFLFDRMNDTLVRDIASHRVFIQFCVNDLLTANRKKKIIHMAIIIPNIDRLKSILGNVQQLGLTCNGIIG